MSALELEQGTIASTDKDELLTVYVDGQIFGIPILQIQDVLRHQSVTPVPLSGEEIEGALNLRGRIVTAINIRKRLGLADLNEDKRMSVVVEYEHELFSLIVDKVGDVLRLDTEDFEKSPATLDETWLGVSLGIYQLEDELLIVLDVPKLLNFKDS